MVAIGMNRVQSLCCSFMSCILADLTMIISALGALGARLHLYGDEAQLYLMCHLSDTVVCVFQMQTIVMIVQAWMSSDQMKLNPKMTEIIYSYGWAQDRYDQGLTGSDASSIINSLESTSCPGPWSASG